MLTIVIFSKDRPLQLDLTLKSVELNLEIPHTCYIIYDTSNSRQENAYDRLICEHRNCTFIQGLNNGMCLEFILLNTKDPFFMFLTDDNIVYKKVKTTDQDLRHIFSRDIASLSLRLGLNITKNDQTSDKRYARPETESDGIHIVWNRMQMTAGSYWNYPLSLDGHIFMTPMIRPIISDIYKQNCLSHPNKIEQMLQRYFFEVPSYMASETTSCVVNSPNNRVQELVKNWYGRIFPVNPDCLLLEYELGKRIDLQKLKFNVTCPHQEINILEGLE
jgi:hypothetical protein